MATLAKYRTLKLYTSSERSPRRKMRYFRYAMMEAAKAALRGTKAYGGVTAGTITSANYATILAVYKRPWRLSSTAGAEVDVLKWIAYDTAVRAVSAGANTAAIIKTGGATATNIVDWYRIMPWLCANLANLLTDIGTRTGAIPSTKDSGLGNGDGGRY